MDTQEKATHAGSYIGGIIAALSGLTLNEWGVLFGIILGVGSFVLNVWFKSRVLKEIKSQGVKLDVD